MGSLESLTFLSESDSRLEHGAVDASCCHGLIEYLTYGEILRQAGSRGAGALPAALFHEWCPL